LLDAIWDSLDGLLTIGLFKNDPVTNVLTTLAAFVEADFAGYVRQVPTSSVTSGLIGPRAVRDLDPYVYRYFGGVGNYVYGYFVLDGFLRVVWFERDPNAPVRMSVPGDTYTLNARLSLRTEFGNELPVLHDIFHGVNGTLLPAHAIAPSNDYGFLWSGGDGTLDIQANQCHGAIAGPDTLFATSVVDWPTSDVTLSASTLSGGAGVVLRYLDGSNKLLCFWDVIGNIVYLWKVIAGAATTIGSALSAVPSFTLTQRGSVIHVVTGSGTEILVSVPDLLGHPKCGVACYVPTASAIGDFALSG
jgi:hypothetical protein